jgi:hypothetical protein
MPEARKEDTVVVAPTRARQGIISHRIIWVLLISTIGAFIVLAILYLFYFG